ncbi:hypothetical protein [Synechococcus sp. PCC 6312]|uniref:hypothetical protein n=1 Tax=Synechococcus sp. (strain ATCC 27167 / PCC 6312) TaxID=195253 RepID=UPI0002EFD77E|nr:hypothetical protein [Synechococcus sp. PCC 6312]
MLAIGSSNTLAPYLLYLDSRTGIKKKIKLSSLIEFIDSLFNQYQDEIYGHELFESFTELDLSELEDFLSYFDNTRDLIKSFLLNYQDNP